MKRNPYLKVKIKSLAAEAKIIRAEELKFKKQGRGEDTYREGLYLHRTRDVRGEARLSLLTYQYLRGVPYEACEKPRKENKIRSSQRRRIAEMVKRFMPSAHQVPAIEEGVQKWLEGGDVGVGSGGRRLPSVRSHNGFSQSAA